MRRVFLFSVLLLGPIAVAASDTLEAAARFELARQELAKKPVKPKETPAPDRQPAAATVADATSSGGVLPFDALFGLGAQLGRGFQVGPSFELRSPWLLPAKIRPYIDAGFFFPLDRKFYSLPVSGGFLWKGPQESWSPLSVALSGGVLFTNETGTPKSLLVLGSVGWETRYQNWNLFLQARLGAAGGDFIAYPRFGLIVIL